jgi:16S rRNA U516 pseudouridylate synthase RsuA-like enzyme
MALKRIAFGSLTLGDLAIGKWRFITKMEQKSIDIQS